MCAVPSSLHRARSLVGTGHLDSVSTVSLSMLCKQLVSALPLVDLSEQVASIILSRGEPENPVCRCYSHRGLYLRRAVADCQTPVPFINSQTHISLC